MQLHSRNALFFHEHMSNRRQGMKRNWNSRRFVYKKLLLYLLQQLLFSLISRLWNWIVRCTRETLLRFESGRDFDRPSLGASTRKSKSDFETESMLSGIELIKSRTYIMRGLINNTHFMYGTLAGMWYLAPGSKSSSERNTGGFIPEYCSLQNEM